jgi:hypothetical protein
MILFGRADLWEETGDPEGRAAEADERRAARAQANLTAYRTRQRAGRKRRDKNPCHSGRGIEVD